MATIFSHAIAAVALGSALPRPVMRRRVIAAGALLAMMPDADVLSFRLGIAYGDMLGHRGLTHSIFFAACVAAAGAFALLPRARPAAERALVWAYLFLATASHGLLDAMTDGGHGVAFFAPFERSRYFLPFTPIAVSPIGASRFFSARGVEVLTNELVWVWLPAAAFTACAFVIKRISRRCAASEAAHRGCIPPED